MPDEINVASVVTANSDNDYELLTAAYYGTGGFLDGSYLVQHSRETDTKYTTRKGIAYYLNYVKPLVGEHVNPVFRKDAVRTVGTNDQLFAQFLEDVDANSTPIERFVKHAAINAKLKGSVFIVVDTPQEQPLTKAGVIEQRAFPYCYTVTPESVLSYIVTKTGKITYITYSEQSETDPTKTNTRVWSETYWQLKDDGGNVIEQGDNPLGVVPVICFRAYYDDPLNVLPASEFMAIATTCKQLFNRCSWWDEILMNQAFAVLTYPAKQAQDLTIGVNNAIGFDGENSKFAPAFISPPADPANMIQASVDFMVQEIYRMAGVSSVTGVKEAVSGVAKQWDFTRLNNMLVDFAFQCQQAERQIVKLFGLWTGKTVDYTVEYSNDFSLPDITTEIDNALKVETLALGKMFKVKLAEKLIAATFPQISDEEKATMLLEVESEAEDAKNADPAAYNEG